MCCAANRAVMMKWIVAVPPSDASQAAAARTVAGDAVLRSGCAEE